MTIQMPFRRILVTGGSGFVGRHLIDALRPALADGARIVVGRSSAGGNHQIVGDAADVVVMDLNRPDSVRAAIDAIRPDAVVHLAGQASVATATGAAAQTWRLNVTGTLALAEAVEALCPAATVLFASSAEVYGTAFLDGPVRDGVRPDPRSVYARSKLAAEQILSTVLPATVRLLMARPTNHVGPGQGDRFVLPSFAAQIVAIERGERPPVIQVGNLDSVRDFMDVRDVAAAYVRMLSHADAMPTPATLTLASGVPRRVGDLLDMMIAISGVAATIAIDPARARPSEIPIAAVDPAGACAVLGWSPSVSIEKTIADILTDARNRARQNVRCQDGL